MEKNAFSEHGGGEGRLDGTKFSQGCRFRNVLCYRNRCAFETLRRRFDSTISVPIANTDNKQGRFDSIKCSEKCRFRKLGGIEPLVFRNKDSERRFDSTKFHVGYI